MLIGGITLVSVLIAVLICTLTGGFASFSWLWILPAGFAGSFVILAGLAFGFLVLACKMVDFEKEQLHDSPFYRQLAYLYIDALKTCIRMTIRTQGLEQTPKDGRFVLACNHLWDADPAVLLSCFRKSQLAFISKKENKDMFVVGPIMHKIMCQLIDRENDRQALKTIIKCIQLIRDDEVSIGIFPEGYCSLNGKLHHFRSGVFKIAQKAQVPIVVCTIRNTLQVKANLPKLRPTTVELHLVGVIPAEELAGRSTVDIANQVHKMMADDLGPDLVEPEENT